MKRRDVLRRTSVAAAVAVGAGAGCLSDPDDGGNDDGSTETDETDNGETSQDTTTEATDDEETNRETTTEEAAGGGASDVTARSISTTNTDCQSSGDSETASVSFGDGQVDLSGVVSAPDPCHEAAFESAKYDGDEFVVVIGVASNGKACMQCVGVVEYEGSVGFEEGVPETVTVKHRRQEETTTVTTASP
ncbi:hypothetical protein [Halostella pelagica]|uniref:hypothetical protein n=1 Tax=Halostella pelagica TaxID=2583824 RepID=UPI0010803000|nr:hypothetical protein [Halostella pelagica]